MRPTHAKRNAAPYALAFVWLAAALLAAIGTPRAEAQTSTSGTNPTIGSLPMVGSEDSGIFDQTLTLRGPARRVRDAILEAGGRGRFDAIATSPQDVWVRFFGDIRVEVALDSMGRIDLGLFTGFEGGGLRYAIESSAGFGSIQLLLPGEELLIDPYALVGSGLLDEPVTIQALHRDGTRTRTTLEYLPDSDSLAIYQNI